jgi:ABC-type Fe3+-hydroxamate transport system substrate-binding protein
MITTDQCGRIVEITDSPKRIVSLVPSQTELLYDLGLRDEVVGITKFCIHPEEWFRTKTRVGGTKQVNIEQIRQLQPDLIIANKEENVKDQIDALAKEWPVWVSDVSNLAQARDMIRQIGEVTNTPAKASIISSAIKTAFESPISNNKLLRTAYLIWKDPWMTIGGDTFIHNMLEKAGLLNIYQSASRYPEISIEELRSMNCELLLLSSEPYPFTENHIAGLQEQLPDTKILLADGEMFSWYGSRLQQAPAYFQKLWQKIK